VNDYRRFTAGIVVGFVLVLAGSVLATRRSPSTPADVAAVPDEPTQEPRRSQAL
jgi:hypothetical protein